MKTKLSDLVILVPLLMALGLALFHQWAFGQRDSVSIPSAIGTLQCIALLAVGTLIPLVRLLRSVGECQEKIRQMEERLDRQQSPNL